MGKGFLIFLCGFYFHALINHPKAEEYGFRAGKFTREKIFRLSPLDYKTTPQEEEE